MPISEQHRAALAKGRRDSTKVRRYLKAVSNGVAKSNGQAQLLENKLERLGETIKTETDPLAKVQLVQKRINLEGKLNGSKMPLDFKAVEADFIQVAVSYSRRHQISYSAWREVGVPAKILQEAGIRRTRRVNKARPASPIRSG
ncbi:MAG: hypothetical protein OXH10_03145 [bacterium]|nr:hypothetical protein [bacterium]MCY3579157.1 hypothetical protein [bacterium]MYD03545.1 hypothetical protein [Acidimicrobiia bacterium]